MEQLKLLASQKAERDAWIQAKLQENKKLKEKEDARVADEARQTKERLWSPYGRAAHFTNELNIAWKGDLDIFHWNRVVPFRDLVALRVTGHNLVAVPPELPENLPALQVLVLISDSLETLPENIGLWTHLVEMDVTKNKLHSLPDSICDLTNLTFLNLSNNLLDALPDRFGQLWRLENVWVECNRLTQTPPTFGKLRCHGANLSANRFTSWSLSVPELCHLTTLTINLNNLTALPDDLCTLPSLTALSASNNSLTCLPEAFGTLTKLTSLRLDWNRIKELPYSFRHLHALVKIHMEHNPTTMPPPDVIYQGAAVVVPYMEQRYQAWLRQGRRKVVEQLQAVLAALHVEIDHALASNNAASSDWTDLLACFEAGGERVVRGTTLAFYALVLPSLSSTILPTVAAHWAAHPKHRPSEADVPVDFFDLPESILVDAITYYDDEYTCAMVPNETARFRRCACVDPETQTRRPCNRTPAPYQCERNDVALLRTKMVTKEEFKEMQSDSYLMARRERLANAMRAKCIAYINSDAGTVFFEETALKCAKDLMAARAARAKELKDKAKNEKVVANTRRKTLKKIETLHAKHSRRSLALGKTMEGLQKEVEMLEKQLRVAPPGHMQKLQARHAEVSKRIDQAKNELTQMEQDPKLKKLQQTVAKLDAKGGDDDDESRASEHESRKESSVQESRAVERDSSHDDEDEDEASDESDDEHSSQQVSSDAESGDEASVKGGSFMDGLGEIPGLEPVTNWIDAATAIIEGLMDRGPQKKTHVEELAHMYNEHLKDTYTKEKMSKVKNKVRNPWVERNAICPSKVVGPHQHLRVMNEWMDRMGHGNRVVFVAWRDYVRETVATRKTTTQKHLLDEQLAAQNRVAEIELGRLEAARWVKKVNPYTDEEYYQHMDTGIMSVMPPPYWDDIQDPATSSSSSSLTKLPPLNPR
ncbi:Aste57867_5051 [Aphanomyces stellatus]|uniref:Aste57867_5051 protein n=1 Tax=Aphanomyces stellatus TaxID=120398 RepID=A0A485KH73_9STRA|nr:hypothetical protein As57867_005038 [Aphanomyces stellatus]VFT82132.1 Aste57867_5051 [Aphanomyces stellatus]